MLFRITNCEDIIFALTVYFNMKGFREDKTNSAIGQKFRYDIDFDRWGPCKSRFL